jgi:alkanesulfonate monooxygenase SsuD/methylene tetrahydromethanopterin reductase-like flavin-dependent oxidoreductase (luciferase family)
MLFVGGSVPAGAKRAARLRLPFMAASEDLSLKHVYDAECKEIGFTGGFAVIPSEPTYVHVAEDPEKAWAQVGPHMLHDAQSYDQWQKPDQHSAVHIKADDIEQLRASGVYQILTPDQAVEHAKAKGMIMLHPLVGGLSPDLGWECLELFGSSVLPHL